MSSNEVAVSWHLCFSALEVLHVLISGFAWSPGNPERYPASHLSKLSAFTYCPPP